MSKYDPNNKYTLRDPADIDGKQMRDALAAERKAQNASDQEARLSPTDKHYIQREDTGEPVPPEVQGYRDAVRAAYKARKAWILDDGRTIDDLVLMAGCPAWPDVAD